MILRHFYAGRRNEMTCQHEVIQTYYLEDTGAPAGLWACTECKTKFVPITELAAERERVAQMILNGRFLHDAAPTAVFAKECAAAIRRMS